MPLPSLSPDVYNIEEQPSVTWIHVPTRLVVATQSTQTARCFRKLVGSHLVKLTRHHVARGAGCTSVFRHTCHASLRKSVTIVQPRQLMHSIRLHRRMRL